MEKFCDGKEPGVVLTDFDSPMCNGVERALNETVHLLC